MYHQMCGLQWNKVEDPEINLHSHLILDKGAQNMN
jgi:hypothetical protein